MFSRSATAPPCRSGPQEDGGGEAGSGEGPELRTVRLEKPRAPLAMRTLLLLLIATLCQAALVLAAVSQAEIERSVFMRLQVIDVERILTNNRIITKYLRCMLRQGVCPPEARDFRRTLPTILRTLCEKCTDRQRRSLRLIFTFVKAKFPSEWERLMQIYDPKGETKERLENFIQT